MDALVTRRDLSLDLALVGAIGESGRATQENEQCVVAVAGALGFD